MRWCFRAGLGLGLALQFLVQPALAGQAERVRHREADYVVYRVDPATDDLGLYWKDDDGQAFGTLARLRERLARRGRELKFAMNGGIFSTGGVPLGLHVENSRVLRELNLGDLEGGQWNFYLKPNGVFYLADHTPGILESGRFSRMEIRPVLACQSGPLLLEEGQVHPAFRPSSTNYHIRSGAGVTRDGRVVFAISEKTVRFYDFALLFKEKLNCDNALYLDGQICAICLPEMGYKPETNRTRFAGLFAVTTAQEEGPGGAEHRPAPKRP
jgi:uncharacterized protein YigE (DUF2233 family)